MVFHCPYAYFESDVLNVVPIFAVEGGKEYPMGVGLERPYTFGNTMAPKTAQTIEVYNAGDVAAPVTMYLFGTGLNRVEVVNETTGASIIVSGLNAVVTGTNEKPGVIINTDENDIYARNHKGRDVSKYVSLFSRISDFKLEPGNNVLTVTMDATGITAAGTRIEWRGRYSACL